MIYLNQAGTSWPKPAPVQAACAQALQADVSDWARDFGRAHAALGKFLGLDATDLDRLLLTPGCTSSLSVAIQDVDLRPGDRILTSSCEHHATHRPLLKWVDRGVDLEVIPPSESGPLDMQRFRASLQDARVKLVALTAASNVTGDLLPIGEIAELVLESNAMLLVDGAQWVGWEDGLQLKTSSIDVLAFGGHKALHAPWGIGGLYVAPHLSLNTPLATCSIGASEPSCASMPDYCDAGSVDRVALAGLEAAIHWLAERPNRLEEARQAVAEMRQILEQKPGFIFYGSPNASERLPTLAFNVQGLSSADSAGQLQRLGLQVASGYQCAPLAHQILGTDVTGTVRISVGPANSRTEMDQAIAVLEAWDPTNA